MTSPWEIVVGLVHHEPLLQQGKTTTFVPDKERGNRYTGET